MSVDTEILFDQKTVNQLSEKHQEPDWMRQFRLDALQKAAGLELPRVQKTRINRWNFTRFEPLTEGDSLDSLSDLPESVQSLLSSDREKDNIIVQKNADPVYVHLDSSLKEKGVIFTDLATAVREHPDLVREYFMTKGVRPDEHRLAALHAALWSGGAFLYVPRGVEVDLPFQSLFWAEGKGVGLLSHVLIVAEANSQVDLVVNVVSEQEEEAVHNGVLEAIVGPGARVRVATINHMGKQATDVFYRRGVVDRDGQLEWLVGDLSGGNTLSDITTHLNGTGGRVDVRSIVVGSGEQRSNVTATVHHWGTHTESDILSRGVMRDEANSIINGITKIERGATKANGQQAENVLMLNPRARGDANPILLIDENDVKAGHAASVGRIDEIQLFYLMSRGISREDAEKLIIYGFLAPVLSAIPFDSLKEQLNRIIERKLQQ
ncbi:MAG: Fe-S cluster assembly protein SufD [Planifilum sp.]|jgi:Fe-S cluster assembly protein SufD